MADGKNGIVRRAAGLGALAAAGGIGFSRFAVPHDLTLPPALSGERREFEGKRAGRLSFYLEGDGPPLLLLHSINAAGSAYEVGPLFERLRGRRLYAPDLPGFGFSDRSNRAYHLRLYVDAVHDMLDVIAAEAGPVPIDAMALSLTSEFLARAATERPERFRSLALVTPTGFEKGANTRRGPEGSAREIPGLHRVLTVPIWGQALFDGLASRASIRYFLQRTFGSKQVPEDLVDYDYLTTHRPGAKNAPFAFLSGRLFSADIRTVYENLNLPVFVGHGTKGDFQDFSEAGWTETRPNWRFKAYDTGALVHFERPDLFAADYEGFLATLPAAAGRQGGRVEPGQRASA
jgi:pimeloyl-ACP methyl ester carboxylesterase